MTEPHEKERIKKQMDIVISSAIALGAAAAVLFLSGVGFVAQRVATADFFDVKIVMVDQGAIGGVVAILVAIACTVGVGKCEKKYKELRDKL